MIEALKQIDTEWFLAINQQSRNGFFDLVCPFIRNASNWYIVYGLIIYILFTQYQKQAWYLLLTVALTVLVSDQISGNLIKNTIERLRPCNEPLLNGQVHLLVNCGTGYSFVSSHATNHFAVALFLCAVFGKRYNWIWPVTFIWAAAIGFSQIYVGVHYPLDVICGSLLGITIGTISFKVVRTKIFRSETTNNSL